MNCLIAQAAKFRATYIQDKDYYGIECNNCTQYLNFLNCYFLKQCESSGCNCSSETTLEYQIITDCADISATEITTNCSDIVVNESGNYISCTMSGLEIMDYLLFEVNTLDHNAMLRVSSFIVNSVEQINATRIYTITPDNISTSILEGKTFIDNIYSFLNSLEIPNFYFEKAIGISSAGKVMQGMRVTYPQGFTWQLTTLASGTPPTGFARIDGYIISQNGLQSYTIDNAVFNPPATGGSLHQLNTVNGCTASTINL